ncbi:MAG TPA: response regulator [Longimicrobium sp.]|nr:response regulator [Longimicrobium sp.]
MKHPYVSQELPRKKETILLADDEPFNLEWVTEYLESKGFTVEVVDHVDAALAQLRAARFRIVIADLSIPAREPNKLPQARDPLTQKYPGLVIAEYARNRGHLGRQVVVYSVHDDPLVQAFTQKIGCTYIHKGRPRQFKVELDEILKYDPLGKR